jgi:hypothetical protein
MMGAFDDLIAKKPQRTDDFRRDGKRIPTPEQFDQVTQSASALDNFAAGMGGGMRAPYLGTKQAVGAAGDDDVTEYFRTMDSLRKTKAGLAGEVAGQVAPQIAAAMFPWTNTLLGSGTLGLGTGFAQPVRPEEQGDGKYPRVSNAVQGAMWGSAFPAVTTLLRAGGAIARPFFKKGQEKIAGDVLNRMASNGDDAIRNARTASEIVPGSRPTLSQATMDPGLASLEQTMYAVDPTKARAALINRVDEQTAARLGAVRSWAGGPAQMTAAEQAREAAAGPLYQKAFSSAGDASVAADPVFVDRVTELMKKPAIRDALKSARTIAANEGMDLKNPAGTVQGMHYMKKALDDAIQASEGNAKRALMKAQEDLLGVIDDLSPDYKAARAAYAAASKPIDQMKVGQRLVDKSTDALMQGSGNEKLYAQKFGQLVANEDSLVRQATGFKSGRGLQDVLEPSQFDSIQGVLSDLQRAQRAKDIGRPLGSPTAQYLTGKDIVRSIAGPVGLPQSFADSMLAETLASRPVSFALKSPEERVMGLLGDALTDPKRAAQLMEQARKMPPGPARDALQRQAFALARGATAAGGPGLLQPAQE